MNQFVKSSGGNLVRIGQAIDGFKSKYGYWPIALQIETETLDMLKKYHIRGANGILNLFLLFHFVPIRNMYIRTEIQFRTR